jgi:hypothetical protein
MINVLKEKAANYLVKLSEATAKEKIEIDKKIIR